MEIELRLGDEDTMKEETECCVLFTLLYYFILRVTSIEKHFFSSCLNDEYSTDDAVTFSFVTIFHFQCTLYVRVQMDDREHFSAVIYQFIRPSFDVIRATNLDYC